MAASAIVLGGVFRCVLRIALGRALVAVSLACAFCVRVVAIADELPVKNVEGQPLAANVRRVGQALAMLGRPWSSDAAEQIETAARKRDADALQAIVDRHVFVGVAINPESRVKVIRGEASASLQQGGYTPMLIKVINESTITKRLKIISPQSGPVYAGAAALSLQRQQQTELGANPNKANDPERFLSAEMFTMPPLTEKLSGLEVEYAIALIYCHEAGKREATIGFDVEQGNQDLGFRGEVPILFDVKPAVAVQMNVVDENGRPTMAKLLFRDELGNVYPPQAKRVAPDLFFQPHVYRATGEAVLLPPGKFMVEYSRGPEYRVLSRQFEVPATASYAIDLKLERWVDPAAFGYYSGDHHIHGAGCAHYTVPTEGVSPADMFRQVKGEGLNVGSVLTWGPCFRFQRQYFQSKPNDLTEPLTVLKYDLEISGFGSQSLGHVCLLNLSDQTYPGSDGLETQGWPTWTVPVLKWCKEQGGVTGYAHSASGLSIDEKSASRRLMRRLDVSGDEELSPTEVTDALLPEAFAKMDTDASGTLSMEELTASHARAAEQLPNLAIPEMNGVGAMELPVSVAEGVCDFISAMDTRRIQEWNTWYHVLNCGFPLKASGETDFPCMSSRNVGQGRSYVRLGDVQRVDYAAWCEGIRAGKSYVSDGYVHALGFRVVGLQPGDGDVQLAKAGTVKVMAKVAFASETPLAVAYGGVTPPAGRSVVGDTVELHGRRYDESIRGGKRLVEIVVNGQPVASREVVADGNIHDLQFDVPIRQSSWVALRHFPQMHTNPVNVIVGGKPIRASKASAQWCLDTIDLLWANRHSRIAAGEAEAAEEAYERARDRYRQIKEECAE
ncbi:MAG TPA: CehA/McbA family metallohydrolase [Pirellulaceae bacterium]